MYVTLFSCNLLVLSNINHCDIKYGVRCGVYYETYCGGGSHCSPSGWCSYSLAYQIHSANSIYSRKFSACYRNDLNSIYIYIINKFSTENSAKEYFSKLPYGAN